MWIKRAESLEKSASKTPKYPMDEPSSQHRGNYNEEAAWGAQIQGVSRPVRRNKL
jgi:hypothetical protein